MENKKAKLLALLERDCRSSLKEIANEMHISKQAVHSRLTEINGKEINSYLTIINYFKLGYQNVHLYLKFDGLKEKEYKTCIERIERIESVKWIADFLGEFDLAVSIFYKDLNNLAHILKEIYSIIGNNIKQRKFYFILKQAVPSNNQKNINYSLNIEYPRISQKIRLDKVDINILKEIQTNGRYTYSELSDNIKISRTTIKNRIENLERNKIILGHKPLLNYSFIDKHVSICIIKLVPGVEGSNLVDFIIKNKEVIFVSTTIDNELIIDFTSSNYEELKKFINQIKLRYKNKIEDYKILNVNRTYKMKFI